MRLYVANCTQQVHDFVYRVPERVHPMKQAIPMGGQIMISLDLNQPQIDSIIGQHAKYGLVAFNELDRSKGFRGLCYSVDKPVTVDRIIRLVESNRNELIDLGKRIRVESAIALNNTIEDSLPDNDQLNKLEVSVVEETRDAKDDSPVFAEGVRIDRTKGDAPPRRPRQRRSRAA